jgi:hypothetical protein
MNLKVSKDDVLHPGPRFHLHMKYILPNSAVLKGDEILFFTTLTMTFHHFLPHDSTTQVETLCLVLAFANSCLQTPLGRLP